MNHTRSKPSRRAWLTGLVTALGLVLVVTAAVSFEQLRPSAVAATQVDMRGNPGAS
jgi:hypothetical protein